VFALLAALVALYFPGGARAAGANMPLLLRDPTISRTQKPYTAQDSIERAAAFIEESH